MLTAAEYEEIKTRELEDARALVDIVQSSDDPRVRYRDDKYPVTDLRHALEVSAKKNAGREAVLIKDSHNMPYRIITHDERKADVDRLGTALVSKGLAGKKVAVLGENGYAWGLAYLAVLCGTGIAVPLDRELTTREIENLLIDSETEGILYTKKYSAAMDEIRKGGKTNLKVFVNLDGDKPAKFETLLSTMLALGDELLAQGNRDFLDAQIINTDPCVILYTSGTTGLAKGVMLSHRNFVAELLYPASVINITENDRFFSVLPMHHTYEGTCGFLIPMYCGSAIAYCEGLKYIVPNLAEARPTVFLGVPLLFENLYKKIWQNIRKQGKEKLLRKVIKINRVTKKIGLDIGKIFFKKIVALFGGRLRLAISGGAPINPEILDFLQDIGITPIQGYGLTECAPICAVNPDIEGIAASAGYLARPFEGKIIDEDENGIGEICVRGPNVMLGYYKNEEATREVLIDGWLHTGDFGYIKDGFVYITGRKKNVIITRNGKNVFPEEIEFGLLESDYVAEAMVFSQDNKKGDDIIITASLYPDHEMIEEKLGADKDNDEKVDLEQLMWTAVDEYNESAAGFKMVKSVILRDEPFIKNTSKKIVRFNEKNKEGKRI